MRAHIRPNAHRWVIATISITVMVSGWAGASVQPKYDTNVAGAGTNHLWLTNPGTSSGVGGISYFNTSTAHFSTPINAPAHHLVHPSHITSDGSHFWVTNSNSIVEFTASGTYVTYRSNGNCASCDFSSIAGITNDGADIYVTSSGNNRVTELTFAGTWLHTFAAGYGFVAPSAIATNGTDVWVGNSNNKVTEFPAGGGVAHQLNYGFSAISSITAAGGNVWVTSSSGTAHTLEFPAPSGTTTADTATTACFSGAASATDVYFVCQNGVYEYTTANVFVTLSSPGAVHLEPSPRQITVFAGNVWILESRPYLLDKLTTSDTYVSEYT